MAVHRGGRPAPAPPSAATHAEERPLSRRVLGGAIGGLLVVALLAWATLALHYSRFPGFLTPLYAAANLIALLRFRRRALPWLGGLWLVIFGWWTQIPPSNDREWRPDVTVLARAEIDDKVVTVRDLRNFDYVSADEFTVRYEDRTYNLEDLQGLDYIFCYWGDFEAVAHTMFSFDFGSAGRLALSIEVRLEKGEFYDPIAGLFKRYEIAYVLGDERDLLRLRTNFRGERVFVFPTNAAPFEVQALLVHILERVNELHEKPAFYHTIGNNCTTAFVNHINAVWPGRVAFHRKLLMNGFAPELAYERGSIRNDRPFEEIKRLHRVDVVAQEYAGDPEFSRRIREHLP